MTKATLFTNGRIFLSPLSPGQNAGLHTPPSFASCLLIHNDTILHVGSPEDEPITTALSSGEQVETVDLAGASLLPGFIDGHMHLMIMGQSLTKLDLGACKTLADIQSTIRSYAAANPHVPRILCRGWMHSMTPGGVTAKDLDGLDIPGREGGERPILVDTKDLHSAWCNTAGIRDLGAQEWKDVPGGTIERDAEGKVTGVFTEAANITYVWPYLARVASVEERVAAIQAAVEAYHAVGYTGAVDMAMDEGAWDALQELRRRSSWTTDGQEGIPLRIAAYWLVKPGKNDEENVKQVERAIELAKEFNAETTPDCRIVGVKVICDGIIDACTAGLSEPYEHNGHREVPLWTAGQLIPVVKKADEARLQVALHAIGDEAIKTVVDVLIAHASPERRPRVEHLELSSAKDAERLGKAGITASIQPVHADPAILRAWPKLLGAHRCARAFAYREFADHGAPLALGSDAPTAPHPPLPNVYVGTTRRSYREPDYETTVNPHFALGVAEAVAAASQGVAYSCRDENRIGRLEKGFKADFTIVNMEWEKEKLKEAKVLETWFDGNKVWSAKN
ncbi:amidohydrolase 3 [Pseudoneurospora amorphoporcata]|uniref:Amidohydrolase 3 n=1 Tax=Pseudoneurospora amorphoporcata TaxID=241081 RepID=A0AAN6NUW0_9PEZI|nr:amidohydrolase 3 [Pseudoneurospora amorphoporcata]